MKRFISVLLIAVLVILAGCASEELSPQTKEIKGKWAYIHDEETVILNLKADGTAKFHDKDYTYDCDEQFIKLTADGETLNLRYYVDGDDIYIYEQTVYKYDGEGKPDGIAGLWTSAENNWEFEFTENGTFKEDGYFPGYYSVDEEAGTFKLVYNDQFEDTVCYYRISGDEMLLEYPWHMVKAK